MKLAIEITRKYWLINRLMLQLRKRHNFETRSHGFVEKRGGLYREALLRLPFGRCLDITQRLKSYAEATGFPPDWDVDWILDEFDSSFDRLAISSLRYHMEWAVTVCSDEKRERFQAIIDDLSNWREATQFSTEDLHHLGRHRIEDTPRGSRDCGECAEIFADHERREADAVQRQSKARHDFVDVMPALWS